jgi:outer membrane biosynthesis protein TonB
VNDNTNPETPVTETPVETPKAKKTPKAKPSKEKAKSTKKDSGKKPSKKVDESKEGPKTDTSIPAGDRRKKVVQALRTLSATVASSSVNLEKIGSKTGLQRYDVYGAISGHTGKAGSDPRCLLATGLVKTKDGDEGLEVYLTAKGKSTTFDVPPFAGRNPSKK